MLFAALIERLRVWRRERETLTELRRLRQRDLQDIGLDDLNLADVARTAARA